MKYQTIMILSVCLMTSYMYAQMTVKDTDTHVLMQVTDEGAAGSIRLPAGVAPSATSEKLYNVSGALYWNGSELATSGSGGGWTDDGSVVRLSGPSDQVGIGTASPAGVLTLQNSVSTEWNSMLHVYAPGAGSEIHTAGIQFGRGNSANECGVMWFLPSPTSSMDCRMTLGVWGNNDILNIEGTGKVGIGTSSTEFKLSLDNDGGILAKGIIGSGSTLSTSGEGTRLIWYPKKAAFRAGYANSTQWDDANIGNFSMATGGSSIASGFYSTAMGEYTMASGRSATAMGTYAIASSDYSTAMGYSTVASSDHAMAMGHNNIASGFNSTAMGFYTTASGQYSTSMGGYTTAGSSHSVAMGFFNVGDGSADTWVDTDPILEIGIGSDISNRANAMTVLKNGNVGIGTANPDQEFEIHKDQNGWTKLRLDNPSDGNNAGSAIEFYQGGWEKAYIAVTSSGNNVSLSGPGSLRMQCLTGHVDIQSEESVRINVLGGNVGIGTFDPEFKLSLDDDGGILAKGSFGSGSTLSTSGEGTRLIWYPGKAAFRAGYVSGDEWNNANIGDYSIAMGSMTKASGDHSTAMGYLSTASGSNSTVTGYGTAAIGSYSTAMGYGTTASGDYSTAVGRYATASGGASTAMGLSVKAESYASVAIGNYNVGGGTGYVWVDSDPLFEIGIGTGESAKANAMTVLKNGKVGIGNHSPDATLHVTGDLHVSGDGIINERNNGPFIRFLDSNTAPGTETWVLQTNAPSAGNFRIRNETDAADRLVIDTDGNVGIGTIDPAGKLDVNGTIYQRGTEIHADYVFEADYLLESIEDHAEYMWTHKHLKAIPKMEVDEAGREIVEVGSHRKGIVEELEKAHIYIEQLYQRIESQQVEIEMLKEAMKSGND